MKKLIIFFVFVISFAHGENGYIYNPLVPCWDWFCLEPYFLPLDHPLKPKLDRLFSSRVTLSKETMEKAGFQKITLREPTNIVVGHHPFLQGYLVKAYLDAQPALIDWVNWLNRIKGAATIKSIIEKYHLKGFVVPNKWIYPLSEHPSPPSNYNRKNFILIVENMDILSNKKNLKAYKDKMTLTKLRGLFILLSEGGLIDSVYPDNVPFTKKGQIAFIDTEHSNQWPVKLFILKQFLSPTMQDEWEKLINP